MVRWFNAVRDNAWVRVGLLLVVALALLWTFGLTPRERLAVVHHAGYWVGVALPAVILGAAWGWIRFSVRQWLWVTAALLVVTAVVMVAAPN